jgi:hypothetical protein
MPDLLLQLLVVVEIRHAPTLELGLDLLKPLLNGLESFGLLSLTALLLVLVDRDEYAYGLSCKLVPGLPAGMLAYEHGDHVVLRERVLLKLLLPLVLVHLLVLGLQLLRTAAVVAREPSDVRKEGLEVGKDVLGGILAQYAVLMGGEVVAHLSERDHGDEVEIEDAVDLDPLQADEVVARTEGGDQLPPQILGDEVVLVLGKGELHLQSVDLLVSVELLLQRLQRHSKFTNVLLLVGLNQPKNVLQEG